jgi:hypothetical protein
MIIELQYQTKNKIIQIRTVEFLFSVAIIIGILYVDSSKISYGNTMSFGISGSHGDENEDDDSLLGYCAV